MTAGSMVVSVQTRIRISYRLAEEVGAHQWRDGFPGKSSAGPHASCTRTTCAAPVYVVGLVLQLVVLEDVQPPALVGLARLGRRHMLQHHAARNLPFSHAGGR